MVIKKENKADYINEVCDIAFTMGIDTLITIEEFGNNPEYKLILNVDEDGDFRFFLSEHYGEDIRCNPLYEDIYESEWYFDFAKETTDVLRKIEKRTYRHDIKSDLSYIWDKFVLFSN